MSIIFPKETKREGCITVDGYSNMNSLVEAVKDFGRYIERKYKNGQGRILIDMANDGFSVTNNPFAPPCEGGVYFFEYDEVPCASELNEDTATMKYAEANYYFVIRFSE